MLYYIIKDLRVNSYLTDNYGRLIRCSTIADCLDFLEFILKFDIDENSIRHFRFDLRCDVL